MQWALHIVGCWVLLSFTLGPCMTLWIFRGKRRARSARARWIAIHPTAPLEQMPAALRRRYAEADFVTRNDIERFRRLPRRPDGPPATLRQLPVWPLGPR
jgi:hypothetical protein